MDDVAKGAVVHVVQHLSPGGLEVMALELARVQAALGVPTIVVSLEGDKDQAIAAWPRLASQRGSLVFMGKRPGLDLALPGRMFGLFRALRPICVHTHHAGPLLYAAPAARLAGVRARIHTEHDAWHLSDSRRRRVMSAALALGAPVLVADAPHVADAFQSAMGGPRPVVVMNGVDLERFSPGGKASARRALGLPPTATVIGVAARLETVKGVDVAIDAMAEIEGPALLAVAGHGSEAEALRARAEARGVSGRVRFLGLVDDMRTFHRAVDLLVLPSRNEGLPLAILEAQACGTPVVASRVGGVPAGVCPETGFLVDAENPVALARAIAACLLAAKLPGRASPRDFVARTSDLAAAARAYLDIAGATAR